MTEAGWQVYRELKLARKPDCILDHCLRFQPQELQDLPKAMQVAVSIAVVLLALSIATASDDVTVTKPTLSQKLEKMQQDVQNFFERAGEKIKAAFRDLHHSNFSNKTRSWFAENFQTLKEKFKTFSKKESD